MLSSIDKRLGSGFNPVQEFIRKIKDSEEPEILPKIFELWKSIEFEDYLSNPAICASRSLDDGQQGNYQIVIGLPDGTMIYEDDVIQWDTPGRGGLRHDPAMITRIMSCEKDTDHYAMTTPFHCGRMSCPACYHYEITYNATQQAIKLFTGSKYATISDYRNKYIQHVVASPPERLYFKFLTWEGFQEMKRYAIKVASDAGITGGLIIFHPYRQNGINDDDLSTLPDDYTPAASNDLDKHHARFAPHFHILGFGYTEKASADFMEKHKGWLYSSLWDEKKTIVDVINAITYLMSHAGLISEASPYQSNRQIPTISWIGLCNSKNLLYVAEIRIGEEQLCPQCGHNIIVHRATHQNQDLEYQGKLYKYQKFPIFTDSAHKDRMTAVYEKYHNDSVGFLHYLDVYRSFGVCYMSSKDLDRRLSHPAPIRAIIDQSIHVPDVYAYCFIPKGLRNKRLRRLRIMSDLPPDLPPEISPDHPPDHVDLGCIPAMDVAIISTGRLTYIDYPDIP